MIEPDLQLAAGLFGRLRRLTADGPGVTRASYGPGEQAAHDLMRETAKELGMETCCDAAGNLYMTLPGLVRERPCILTGSHLDSVPRGGNFDGAAGVVAGLSVAAALRRRNRIPPQDFRVMAIRAEESTWFPVSYIGSRAALGLLPEDALKAQRADSGRSLADHMETAGFDPVAVRKGEAGVAPASIGCFIELHIEQGPTLVAEALPLALVTGIRGSCRYRTAKCRGEYGHSGAVPRGHRRDAVFAVASLIAGLDALWVKLEEQGHDLTVTLGQLQTDPREHAFSKIPGLVRFCVDFRSLEKQTLLAADMGLQRLCREIASERKVSFELGPISATAAASMDASLLRRLTGIAEDLGIPHRRMASGAGHDASVFANAGISSGMIFVRNQHGSHNAKEAMELDDFDLGCRLLATLVQQELKAA